MKFYSSKVLSVMHPITAELFVFYEYFVFYLYVCADQSYMNKPTTIAVAGVVV
jgi:hypothetical protein